MAKQTAAVLALYRQGQATEARAACEALLTITLYSIQRRTLLGASQQQMNFAAANSFRSAITYRPSQAHLYNDLGVAPLNLTIRFNPELDQNEVG